MVKMVDVTSWHLDCMRFEQRCLADAASAGVGFRLPTVQPLGSSVSELPLRSSRVEHSCRPSERTALVAGFLLALTTLSVATPLYADILLCRENHARDGDSTVVNRTPIWLDGVATPAPKYNCLHAYPVGSQRTPS